MKSGSVKSPPPLAAPAPMPVEADLDEAARRERERLRRAAGYRKTLLTQRPTLGEPTGGRTILGG